MEGVKLDALQNLFQFYLLEWYYSISPSFSFSTSLTPPTFLLFTNEHVIKMISLIKIILNKDINSDVTI